MKKDYQGKKVLMRVDFNVPMDNSEQRFATIEALLAQLAE